MNFREPSGWKHVGLPGQLIEVWLAALTGKRRDGGAENRDLAISSIVAPVPNWRFVPVGHYRGLLLFPACFSTLLVTRRMP